MLCWCEAAGLTHCIARGVCRQHLLDVMPSSSPIAQVEYALGMWRFMGHLGGEGVIWHLLTVSVAFVPQGDGSSPRELAMN